MRPFSQVEATCVYRLEIYLLGNPIVSLFKSIPQHRIGLPSHQLLDERVVTAPTPHPLGGAKVVFPLQPYPGNVFRDVDQLVHRDHLRASQVERLADVALHNLSRSIDAVVDGHKAPGLLTIPQNLDLPGHKDGGFGMGDFAYGFW